MALSEYKTWIGTNQRLDGYENRAYAEPKVRVSYEDDDGVTRVVNICASAARVLAKALKQNADFIDPPKPRRKKS